MVSAYESDAPAARKLINNSIVTPLWQASFGAPSPQPGFSESFIPTVMRAKMYLSFSENDQYYRTVIFGGTVNDRVSSEDSDEFLGAQFEAIQEVIERHYGHLGFAG